MPPTLFVEPSRSSALMADEIFGAQWGGRGGGLQSAHGGPLVRSSGGGGGCIVDRGQPAIPPSPLLPGPLLPIFGVAGADEAIAFINARPKPLALCVVGQGILRPPSSTCGLPPLPSPNVLQLHLLVVQGDAGPRTRAHVLGRRHRQRHARALHEPRAQGSSRGGEGGRERGRVARM